MFFVFLLCFLFLYSVFTVLLLCFYFTVLLCVRVDSCDSDDSLAKKPVVVKQTAEAAAATVTTEEVTAGA